MISVPWKLVRDNVPGFIQERGGLCVVRELKGEAFRKALADKLVEEANDLRAATTPQERYIELADLLEVAEAYRVANMMPLQDVQCVRERRNAVRGAFSKGLKLFFAIGRRHAGK